ncbi:hypothetical protein OQ715_14830, partial [Mycobacterium ulcerans]|nr:hypothetical protein [Mycobacterium ulcerans]MEB4028383.1 hypothetical protein [Mycobacterium ulcerans]MEB4057356.1 hypothetical protein [Mycobacterium ulcerans]MEB4094097.1 hypothetical protein [Mycobacterium ulcerans]MEB4227347.1 hypothetical protein [Mycobacterium ulcerans]
APIARHQRSSTQLTSLLINNAGALRKALITPIGGYGYPCATLGRLPRNGRPLANRPLIENCDIDRWLKFRSNARGAFDIRMLLIAPFAETKRRSKVIG